MAAWAPTLQRIAGWVGLLVLVWLAARWFEWRNVFAPSRGLDATPRDAGLSYEDVTFVAEDGVRLHGWWIPHRQARGVLVYCHGNAGNIGDRVAIAAGLHELGLHLFLFDYRGYGLSRGFPTEQGTYRDARAAFEVARARYDDTDRPPVVVYGRSLGGAVALQLALDKPVRAVVVEGAFTSMRDMARVLYPRLPAGMLVHFEYDALAKARRLRVPALFAHARKDDVVPFALGQRLFEAAAGPKEFVALPGGHNEDSWNASAEYRAAFAALLDRVL